MLPLSGDLDRSALDREVPTLVCTEVTCTLGDRVTCTLGDRAGLGEDLNWTVRTHVSTSVLLDRVSAWCCVLNRDFRFRRLLFPIPGRGRGR